jgi:polar amino acid transport system substrate-binding protein
MKLLLRTLILQIILLISTIVAADDSDTPSIQHCNRYSTHDESMTSLFQVLANELGRRLNASVAHVKAPIKRCLRMMKTGQADFMFLTKMTDQRTVFLDYLIPSNNNVQVVFLTRKADGDWLRDYTDLESKTLGLVSGYSHFKKIDADSEINKLFVISWEQLPKVLLGGRVDSIITYDGMANTLLLNYPSIVKAPYYVDHIPVAFLVVSKKSPLHHRLDELTLIAQGMLDDGYVNTMMDEYIPGILLPFPKKPTLN